jgi:hypothetical protein
MHACPGLDAVVATMIDRLNKPDDRLSMLRALLAFSGGVGLAPEFNFAPRTPLEKLLAQAQQSINESFDVPTVENAWWIPTGICASKR